jgi:hypothetical protein
VNILRRVLLHLNPKSFEEAIFTILNRSKPGKQVNLTEAEVRGLCIKARDVFIN